MSDQFWLVKTRARREREREKKDNKEEVAFVGVTLKLQWILQNKRANTNFL